MRMKTSWSIRRRILSWLFLAMALVFSANLLSSYYSNRNAADSAYDRLLLASAAAISERLAMRDGQLYVDLPYAALDMLASTAQDRVFYAILGPDGRLITGYEGLPLPSRSLPQTPFYYNETYKEAAVRIVALRSFVSGGSRSGYATVMVAQTRGERDALTYDLLRRSALWMLIIAITGAIAAWVGVSIGLRPLMRLREALGRRSPEDTRPVLHDVPREFKPLVDAINAMLLRLDGGLKSMRNFIGDASHQLRTPLASLQAQSEMALRESDPNAIRAALSRVSQSVHRTSRLARQLLSYARATEPGEDFDEFDLPDLIRETIAMLMPQLSERNIDLGYEGPAQQSMVASRPLIGELIVNLLDNAIKYSPPGAIVTISVTSSSTGIRLAVTDNGPGIAAAERHKVFDRFVRLDPSGTEGCGLGLAIVREIVLRHHGSIALEDAPGGGLLVSIDFPIHTLNEQKSK